MNKDKFGMLMSIGCLIHCILTPILLPILPLFGLTTEHEYLFHIILGVAVTIIASITLLPGYKRHGDWYVLISGIIGLILVNVSGALEMTSFPNTWLITSLGSFYLISAHYVNHKLLCSCKHHEHK